MLEKCWQHFLRFLGYLLIFFTFFGDHGESSGRLWGAPGVMEGHFENDFGWFVGICWSLRTPSGSHLWDLFFKYFQTFLQYLGTPWRDDEGGCEERSQMWPGGPLKKPAMCPQNETFITMCGIYCYVTCINRFKDHMNGSDVPSKSIWERPRQTPPLQGVY